MQKSINSGLWLELYVILDSEIFDIFEKKELKNRHPLFFDSLLFFISCVYKIV